MAIVDDMYRESKQMRFSEDPTYDAPIIMDCYKFLMGFLTLQL